MVLRVDIESGYKTTAFTASRCAGPNHVLVVHHLPLNLLDGQQRGDDEPDARQPNYDQRGPNHRNDRSVMGAL